MHACPDCGEPVQGAPDFPGDPEPAAHRCRVTVQRPDEHAAALVGRRCSPPYMGHAARTKVSKAREAFVAKYDREPREVLVTCGGVMVGPIEEPADV